MKILEVKNLSVEARADKKTILKNISFEIEEKSIFVLIGPNGSGKSTLAYTLIGIPRFKITSGKIFFLGKEISKLPIYKRARMGLALGFQEPAYFKGISVENFLKACSKNSQQKEIEKALDLVGLEPKKFLKRKMDQQLSSGERKRIELASVIVMKPKLMILDEPDSGLDIIIYKELYDILDNIRQATNASILLITHREEIGFLADQAGFLNKGELVYKGKFDDVMIRYCQSVGRRKRCRKLKVKKT
ncbi:ATP-binding cassette domain-containing protein [bacterium]|nr:ATP-binding cassette domain-containing protein [bacterium]